MDAAPDGASSVDLLTLKSMANTSKGCCKPRLAMRIHSIGVVRQLVEPLRQARPAALEPRTTWLRVAIHLRSESCLYSKPISIGSTAKGSKAQYARSQLDLAMAIIASTNANTTIACSCDSTSKPRVAPP